MICNSFQVIKITDFSLHNLKVETAKDENLCTFSVTALPCEALPNNHGSQNYARAYYDEFLNLRKLINFKNLDIEWELLLHTNGQAALFSIMASDDNVKLIQLTEQGILTMRQNRCGNTTNTILYSYSEDGRYPVDEKHYINGKLNEIIRFSYIGSDCTSRTAYNDGDEITGYTTYEWGYEKHPLHERETLDKIPGQEEALKTRTARTMNPDGKLLSQEKTYFDENNNPVLIINNAGHIEEIKFNTNRQAGLKILRSRIDDNPQRYRQFIYYDKNISSEFNQLFTQSEPLNLFIENSYEVLTDKITGHIVSYDSKGTQYEFFKTHWDNNKWEVQYKLLGSQVYWYTFCESNFLIEKKVYNQNNTMSGMYRYIYAYNNSLLEEQFFGTDGGILRRQVFYYTYDKTMKLPPNIDSVISLKESGGFYFSGKALFDSLVLETESIKNRKLPENHSRHKEMLLHSCRYIISRGLKKIITYNHRGNIVQYTRIQSRSERKSPELVFSIYNKPPNIMFQNRNDLQYYRSASGYFSAESNADVKNSGLYEFLSYAEDSINVENSREKEFLWMQYRFTFPGDLSTVTRASRVFFDPSGGEMDEHFVAGADSRKVLKKNEIMLAAEAYIFSLAESQ